MSRAPRKKSVLPEAGNLAGQFLIAMPGMTDKRFVRTVIYVCAHSAETTMGLIINRRAEHINFSELLEHLDLSDLEKSSDGISVAHNMDVHMGGPVETSRGFVLHTPDYKSKSRTLAVDDGICLTATVDILKAMAAGKGPSRALLALGYAGWAGGQLEAEIRANAWLHCPADEDILFDPVLEQKYERALWELGVDQAHLVSEAGNA